MFCLAITSCIITIIGRISRYRFPTGGWPPSPQLEEEAKYIGRQVDNYPLLDLSTNLINSAPYY